MARACKVCSLDLDTRTKIEAKLRDGVPDADIEEALNALGVSITRTSIYRHRNLHMDIPKPASTKNSDTVLDDLLRRDEPVPVAARLREDANLRLDEYRQLAGEKNLVELATESRRITHLIMEKIVQNQLVICESMQNAYMAGESEYPRDQIVGLRTVLELQAKIPTVESSKITRSSADRDRHADHAKIRKERIDEWLRFFAEVGHGKYRPTMLLEHCDRTGSWIVDRFQNEPETEAMEEVANEMGDDMQTEIWYMRFWGVFACDMYRVELVEQINRLLTEGADVNTAFAQVAESMHQKDPRWFANPYEE